jgi:hypothetical protein
VLYILDLLIGFALNQSNLHLRRERCEAAYLL